MVDIGILTYHNNNNIGGVLQAYCLWKKIKEEAPESNVEIIDYRSRSKEIKRIFSLNPIDVLNNLQKYRDCISFFENNGALSSKKLISDNHEKSIRFINNLDYDMVIAGSDVVWRLEKGGLTFLNRPFPNPYYLDEDLNTLKVSYAASANKTHSAMMTKSEQEIFKDHLSSFDQISVRDDHTESLLQEFGISQIIRSPDPTFLTDIPKDSVNHLLQSAGVDVSKPILGLNGTEDRVFKEIANEYRSRGYQIVSLKRSPYADINLNGDLKPFEYYSVHNEFDLIITKSLHTTIFSIKNDVPFATVDVVPHEPGSISKTHSLLRECSLTDRYIDPTDNDIDKVLDFVNNNESDIDTKKVTKRLSEFEQKGTTYINDLIDLAYEKN